MEPAVCLTSNDLVKEPRSPVTTLKGSTWVLPIQDESAGSTWNVLEGTVACSMMVWLTGFAMAFTDAASATTAKGARMTRFKLFIYQNPLKFN
ncbi:MAG: hypothetical protein GAK37_03625 [Pseudomonas sp.]|nr:MAG: hypothetical protein GAK37_03625 [Pseudomonas sp.]